MPVTPGDLAQHQGFVVLLTCLVSRHGKRQKGEGIDPGVLNWTQDPERFFTFLWECTDLISTALLPSLCFCSYLQCGWPLS